MKLLCPECGYPQDLANQQQTPREQIDPGRPGRAIIICPECGHASTKEELQKHADEMSLPGSVVIGKLLVWPGVMLASSVVPMVSLFLIPVLGITAIIFSGVRSIRIARCVAWTRAMNARNEEVDPKSTGVIAGLFIGFWLAQILLCAFAVFAGCSVALTMMGGLNFH